MPPVRPPVRRVLTLQKKQTQPKEAPVALGPQVAEGENVFGVAHIFAS